MSGKKNTENTEIAVNEGFAALANRDVLNEALADDCQGLEERIKMSRAIPNNCIFDALRKFCARTLLRFLAIHEVLLRNRGASRRKIYT